MGEAAENVAEHYEISREEQDEYALNSHRKAMNAIQQGTFSEEIVPVNGMVEDECVRWNTSKEKLAKLPPVFREGGTVTAGNACPINDGASLVLVMSKEKAQALGLMPVLSFKDATCVGVDPNYLGIGPIPAVQKLFRAILVTRLAAEMKAKKLKRGLATLGIGGGLGLAVLFEGIDS